MKKGIELIAEERQRQIEKEGWTAEHDDTHVQGEIARAAASYALPEGEWTATPVHPHLIQSREMFWPWEENNWKPTPHDRVRELTKAGALIAAEIDRLNKLNKEK